MGEGLTITGPDRTAFGLYGGVSMNPRVFCQGDRIDCMTTSGRFTVRGFYDGVPSLPDVFRPWQRASPLIQTAFWATLLSKLRRGRDRMPIE